MTVVHPRPASTVIFIRPDFSVLLMRRSTGSGFFGGAYAFPGGRVEPSDVPLLGADQDFWTAHRSPPAGLDLAAGDRRRLSAAFVAAAIREVEEEAGVTVAATELAAWSRWITPEAEAKRFDTLFFVARAPAAEIVADGHEMVEHRWLQPTEALRLFDAGELKLPPPTYVVLAELAEAGSRERIFASPPSVLPEIMPVVIGDERGLFILLPGDPEHPVALHRPWPAKVKPRIALGDLPSGWRFA